MCHVAVPSLTPRTVRDVLLRYSPDIAHGHDVTASVCLAANVVLCRRRGIKLVSHLHNNDERMRHINARSLLYGAASLAFPSVIVVSDPVVNEYVFRPLLVKKSTTIVNVIDPELVRAKAAQGDIQKLPAPQRWDVAFVGRLTEQKDPLSFIDAVRAMRDLREIKAVMVGTGELGEAVRTRIKELALGKTIQLVGFQKNPYQFIAKSSIVMMPSRYEGYPMVALESLMLGVPLLGTPVAGLSELIDDRCGRFASTPAEFASAGIDILEEQSLIASLADGAREKAAEVNNVDRFISQLRRVYLAE